MRATVWVERIRDRRVGAAAIALALALLLAGPAPAIQAAPGETWTGTFTVRQEITSDNYSKVHVTRVFLLQTEGVDDDPYTQPLSSWETTYDEHINSEGTCPSTTQLSGEASGTDGHLAIRESDGKIVLEVLDYGAPGTFAVTETAQSCEDNQPRVSQTTASHQTMTIRTAGDRDLPKLSGRVTRLITDGTVTYQWELYRGRTGSDGDDQIKGGDDAEVIEGSGGNDTILAGGGDDEVYGGAGDDSVEGQRGNDLLLGGDDQDVLKGGPGSDVIIGDGVNGITHDSESPRYAMLVHESLAPGPDLLYGGGGGDRLTGGAGLDRFDGGPGRDTCIVDSRKEKRRAKGCEVIKLKRSR